MVWYIDIFNDTDFICAIKNESTTDFTKKISVHYVLKSILILKSILRDYHWTGIYRNLNIK